MLTFFIKIHNTMNANAFSRVPLSERAVFVPQCLRSAKCPAHLTPEGLKCVNCGQCTVGEARSLLEKLGTGSSSFRDRRLSKGWSRNTTLRQSSGSAA